MPYSVDTYSGSETFVVEDGTIDSTLDIRLIGKNYAGYGEVQNENFLHLLENFAGDFPPPRPIDGQIWYDSGIKKIKFYDKSTNSWRSTGGIQVSVEEPTGLTEGDLWWNPETEQLFAFTGLKFVLIGPDGVAGFGETRILSKIVTDTNSVSHAVMIAYVDGDIVFVISSDDAFTLSPQSQADLGGASAFGLIKPGITLVNTNNSSGTTTGTTFTDGKIFWGTVSSSLRSKALEGGETGSVPFQTAENETSFVPTNTTSTRKILSQTGTGTSANNPEWITLPTVLPIATNAGPIVNVPLANGTFPVTDRDGNVVNITVN